MATTPLIYANALAADDNIRSVLRAIATTSPPQNRTRPPGLPLTRIISLTDSEGDDHHTSQRKQQSEPQHQTSAHRVPPESLVFVIEGTPESDEEYQEHLLGRAQKRAAREMRKAGRRGRSAERHTRIAEERERSAELHARLARKAGKLPAERNFSSGSYADADFDGMLANLTLNSDGGEYPILVCNDFANQFRCC